MAPVLETQRLGDADEEKVGRIQIRVVALCAIMLAFDGYDTSSIGFAIPSLAAAWHVAPAAFTSAIVVGSLGMLFGALISGPLGDWFGRRPVFIGSVAIFGICSILSALCATLTELTAARFVTGLGLGGGVPTAIALASDYSPRRWQGTLVSLMSAGVPAGIVIGGMIASGLIPSFGWKSVFLFGGIVPVILLPVLIAWLPESLHFLRGKKRRDTGSADIVSNPVASLFRNGLAPTTLLLWITFAANFLASYLMLLWLPAILNAVGGTPSQAVFGTTLFALAGIIGAVCLGRPIDKFGAERTLAVSLFAGAIVAFVTGIMEPSYQTMLALIFCVGLGVSGSQLGMNALSGAAYPSEIRSTGSGWALGIGRLGNVFGPLLGGILLGLGYPAKAIFLFASGFVLLAALAMAAVGITRRRRQIETALVSERPTSQLIVP